MNITDRLKGVADYIGLKTRYIGTFAGGAVMAVGVLGLTSKISSTEVQQLFDALTQLGTAVSSLLTALGTISGLVLLIIGRFKSSPAEQVKTVRNLPGVESVQVDVSSTSPAPAAVKALATNPDVKGVEPVNGPQS